MKVFGIGVKENSGQASSWLQQHLLTYPLIPDPEGQIYKTFATGSVPFHIIIDNKFIIRYSDEKFDKDGLIRLLDD